MPDIQRYLDDIKKAVYGEEVRGSIHDAIDAINRYTEQYSTKDDIDRAITEALEKAGFSTFKIVDVLPSASVADDHTLYMLYNATSKHYDIYAKLNDKMEWLNDTTIDLSNYVTKEALSHELETKIDKSELEGLSGAVKVENGKFKPITETPPIFTFDAPYGADGSINNSEFDKLERQFAHFTFPKYEETDPLTCNCYTIHFSMSENSPYGDTAPDMGINIIFVKLHLTKLYPEDNKLYTVMYAQYSPGTYLQNGGNCRFYIKNNGEKIITRDGAELRDRHDYYLIPTDVTDLYITAPHITFSTAWFAMHDMKGAKYNIYDLRMSEGVTHEFEVIDRTNKLEFLTSDKNYSELWSDETVVNRAVEAVTLVDEVTFKLEGDVTSPAINTRFDAAYDDGNKIILQTSIDEALKQSIGTAIQTVKVNGEPLVPDESKAVDVKAYNEDNKPEVGGVNLVSSRPAEWENLSVRQTDKAGSTFEEIQSDYTPVRLLTKELIPVSKVITISIAEGFECSVVVFDEEKKYLGLSSGWYNWFSKVTTIKLSDGYYIAVIIRHIDMSDISPNEILNCKLMVENGEIPTDWSPAPEDLDAKIDSIQIGGTNLLLGTKDFSGSEWVNSESSTTESDKYLGFTVKKRIGSYSSIRQSISGKKGMTYTFSCYAKGTNFSAAYLFFHASQSTIQNFTPSQIDISNLLKSDEFTKISGTVSINSDISVSPRLELVGSDAELYYCGYKLERGEIATDWSPAPEDLKTTAENFEGVLPIEKGGTNNASSSISEALDIDNFRGQINQLSSVNSGFIAVGRHETGNEYWPAFSSGIKFGALDTHGYITTAYGYNDVARVDVGGGNKGKILWHKQLAFKDEQDILAQIANRTYQGTDLTVKFKSEIDGNFSGDPWAWIQDRINNANWDGLHVCDYIPFTTTNSVTMQAQIAGIDTYYRCSNQPVPHHIDFITREIWPTLHTFNPVNYNNGTAEQNYPWLASDMYLWLNSKAGSVPNATTVNPETTEVDYTQDGVYYFLPEKLKAVIIEKRFLLETRYNGSSLLTTSPGWAWQNEGRLWLPTEMEVYGTSVWGGAGHPTGGGIQYPIFANSMNRLKYRSGSRYSWWLSTPNSGNPEYWCDVDDNGAANHIVATYNSIGAPVCFRIASIVKSADVPVEGPEMMDEYQSNEMEE